jgi:chemotaxis protein methyltransferase CheR
MKYTKWFRDNRRVPALRFRRWQWDIPALRVLLETIIPDRVVMDNFEVAHDFPGLGPRRMPLNARKVMYENDDGITILLAFQDVTARRAIEQHKDSIQRQSDDLLRQKQLLLEEMRHRVANSLQIIASLSRSMCCLMEA